MVEKFIPVSLNNFIVSCIAYCMNCFAGLEVVYSKLHCLLYELIFMFV